MTNFVEWFERCQASQMHLWHHSQSHPKFSHEALKRFLNGSFRFQLCLSLVLISMSHSFINSSLHRIEVVYPLSPEVTRMCIKLIKISFKIWKPFQCERDNIRKNSSCCWLSFDSNPIRNVYYYSPFVLCLT
jgi:hypothetical protein